MSCLLYEFRVLAVIVLTHFEYCLQTNGITPTTDRPRSKTSPYTPYKLTSIHVPRGFKTRDPTTRAVTAVLYRPKPKINLEQTRQKGTKGELSQFPSSTRPIKSSFALDVRRIASYSGQLQLCTPRFPAWGLALSNLAISMRFLSSTFPAAASSAHYLHAGQCLLRA